jgi:hypothetical protein
MNSSFPADAVIPLTVSISLCLVFTFVVFFIRERIRGQLSSAERDSLMPLAAEKPVAARPIATSLRK